MVEGLAITGTLSFSIFFTLHHVVSCNSIHIGGCNGVCGFLAKNGRNNRPAIRSPSRKSLLLLRVNVS
jgi:hypothetical protein